MRSAIRRPVFTFVLGIAVGATLFAGGVGYAAATSVEIELCRTQEFGPPPGDERCLPGDADSGWNSGRDAISDASDDRREGSGATPREHRFILPGDADLTSPPI